MFETLKLSMLSKLWLITAVVSTYDPVAKPEAVYKEWYQNL
jgi:hypothetical protein